MENISHLKEVYWRIRKYLIYDINCLLDADKERGLYIGCGIYILIVCSGIDFLGSLILPSESIADINSVGLKGRSKRGFIYFVKIILGKIDPIYQQDNIPEFIYDIIRCGQMHEAIVKGGVIIGKEASRDFHLKYIQNINQIYFNPRLFALDFLKSLDLIDEIINNDIQSIEMSKRLNDNYLLTISNLDKYNSSFDHIKADKSSLEIILESSSSFPSFEYSEMKQYHDRYI